MKALPKFCKDCRWNVPEKMFRPGFFARLFGVRDESLAFSKCFRPDDDSSAARMIVTGEWERVLRDRGYCTGQRSEAAGKVGQCGPLAKFFKAKDEPDSGL